MEWKYSNLLKMILTKAILEHSSSNKPSFLLGGNFDKEKGRSTLTVTPFLPVNCKIGDEILYQENSILDIRFYNTNSIDVWVKALQDLKQLMINHGTENETK